MAKRVIELPGQGGDVLTIMPIGAGSEVGRSCILLTFKGKKIMLDCGIHPGFTGEGSLPYFDVIDDLPGELDLILVTHFHLDHCAALPFFLEKTKYKQTFTKGNVFMTHPTKAIYQLLLSDFVKISQFSARSLYDEADLRASMDKITTVNFHQETEIEGIRFTAYNAGHVLGAAMFLIEIAGVRILYTGDYSCEEDRHLMAAEQPKCRPDVLIVESTYGVQVHESRYERENRFTSVVRSILQRGGHCLIPSFALGRAQELLLILDEYWDAHPSLQKFPIYYASALAKRCLVVYRTYLNMMNSRIQKQSEVTNPFEFKHVSQLNGSVSDFHDAGPCVVFASPGMLQSGFSRQLFELWCQDEVNGVIIPGYCVEGTLAKTIMSEPDRVPLSNGRMVPLKMSVDYISFSAHADYAQTSEFIEALQPPNIVLVHGEQNAMKRLKEALEEKYGGGTRVRRRRVLVQQSDMNTTAPSVRVHAPQNSQAVELTFRADKMAKTVGSLAAGGVEEGREVHGIVVVKDFDYHVIAPADLPTYTNLTTSVVQQSVAIPFIGKFGLLLHGVRCMYDDVKVHREGDVDADGKADVNSTKETTKQWLSVADLVDVLHDEIGSAVILRWTSTPLTDMLSDSLAALILQLQSRPLEASGGHKHDHGSGEGVVKMEDGDTKVVVPLEMVADLLRQHYTEVFVNDEQWEINVMHADQIASITFPPGESPSIFCDSEPLLERVQFTDRLKHLVATAMAALSPLSVSNVDIQVAS